MVGSQTSQPTCAQPVQLPCARLRELLASLCSSGCVCVMGLPSAYTLKAVPEKGMGVIAACRLSPRSALDRPWERRLLGAECVIGADRR